MARQLAKPVVNNRYRTEEVDLQPQGATISVITSADNPYENEGEITVVTQASGGMAEPDMEQTSAGRAWIKGAHPMPRPRNNGYLPGNRPSGTAPAVTSVVSANTPMDDDDEDAETPEGQFMFGLAGLGMDEAGAGAAGAPPAASFNWAALTQGVATAAQAAGAIYSAQQQAKIAQANAQAANAQSMAAQAQASLAAMGRGAMNNAKSNWPILVGGALVLGLGVYLLAKRKR